MKVKPTKINPAGNNAADIGISTEFIKLDSFLKLSAAAQTGGEAKLLIQDGEVTVNGEVCLVRGRKLRPGDVVTVGGERLRVVLEQI